MGEDADVHRASNGTVTLVLRHYTDTQGMIIAVLIVEFFADYQFQQSALELASS
jgi:hypothetical protein